MQGTAESGPFTEISHRLFRPLMAKSDFHLESYSFVASAGLMYVRMESQAQNPASMAMSDKLCLERRASGWPDTEGPGPIIPHCGTFRRRFIDLLNPYHRETSLDLHRWYR